ncbi:MAG: hypothetical protein C4292_05830 [Nitrososphaera sp.]
MTHNGVDIVDYVLYTVYPSAAFFAVGFIAKKTCMQQFYVFIIQAAICFAFAGAYMLIPQGGGQGLAIILALFGGLLLLMARRQKIQPASEEEQKSA